MASSQPSLGEGQSGMGCPPSVSQRTPQGLGLGRGFGHGWLVTKKVLVWILLLPPIFAFETCYYDCFIVSGVEKELNGEKMALAMLLRLITGFNEIVRWKTVAPFKSVAISLMSLFLPSHNSIRPIKQGRCFRLSCVVANYQEWLHLWSKTFHAQYYQDTFSVVKSTIQAV